MTSEIIILVDTVKNKRLAKLFSLFMNDFQLFLKDISLKMPVSEFYEAIRDLKRVNSYLTDRKLPKILSIDLMEHNGKVLKVLKKNFEFQINVKNDFSYIEIKYLKVKDDQHL